MLDRNNIEKTKSKNSKKMWRNGVDYTFTINYANKFQYFHSIDRMESLYRVTRSVTNILRQICSSFNMCAEFSTPEAFKCRKYQKGASTGPRFHLHGTIRFSSVINFYIYAYSKLLDVGIFEIDSIQSKKVWDEYVYKDKEVMLSVCDTYHISELLHHQDPISDE